MLLVARTKRGLPVAEVAEQVVLAQRAEPLNGGGKVTQGHLCPRREG